MQHPIGSHALLADGRTAALLDPEGNVAWLCWPRIDSPPCLLAILDGRRGGVFSVRPEHPEARLLSRGYEPGTLVLRTVWGIGGGRLTIEEALAWEGPPRLVRRLSATGGEARVLARFGPAPDAGRVEAKLTVEAPAGTASPQLWRALARAGDAGPDLAVSGPSPWVEVPGGGALQSLIEVSPDAPAGLVLAAEANREPLQISALLAVTREAWGRLRSAEPPPLSPLAVRCLGQAEAQLLVAVSGCVLMGLHNREGGLVAAPTTSLPQWPGSSRTWDYRYSWLRDASLAGLALIRLGAVAEAARLGEFIGGLAARGRPPTLTRVDGGPAPAEVRLDHLEGHRGARPVRIGNAAASMAQLDVGGEVLELAAALARAGALPAELSRAAPLIADWLAGHWRKPDHGIWEIRGRPRHYTHSRLLAWRGLREAARLEQRGTIAAGRRDWDTATSELETAILGGGGGGPLQLHSRGGGPDAALVQLALVGLLPAAHPRVRATLELIDPGLRRGGLLDRHLPQPGELADPCAPFLFPTFWAAQALEASGGDGSELFAAAAAARGSADLFGEVADPFTGAPLGNFPQVQSHAAFILAATAAPEAAAATW